MEKFCQSIFVLTFAVLTCQMHAADVGAARQYTGMVVDERGQPVAGATVDCYQYRNPPIMMGSLFREPELKQQLVTDNQGAFIVAASPDTTLVVVKKTGLAPAWKTWLSNRADSSDRLVLTAPTTLSGVVVDENDKPMAGAEVVVSTATVGDASNGATEQNDLFGRLARECFSAQTALDGSFRIKNFPADGRASLAVNKPGLAQRPTDGTYIGSQDYRSGQQEIKLKLGPAGAIEGKVVVQETSQPVAGVEIRLMATTGAGGTHGPVQSGADGTFRIADLEPAIYNVWATMPGKPVPEWAVVPEYGLATVVAGETTRDVQVHATAGVMVEVTVVSTNDMKPLANVAVSSGRLTAYTDADGVALLRMTPGKSLFSARKDWARQQTTVEIKAGQTNHVQIELIPPPHITGTVRDSFGTPAAGVLVSFHPGIYPDAPDYAEVMTDKNGRYEMILKLSREDFGWDGLISPTNFILARSLERNLAAIHEFAAIPTSLDMTLQPGITLAGSVKDVEGAPVTNATVDFRIESGRSSRQMVPPLTKVDAQGSFIIPAMPRGRTYYFFNDITAKGYGTAGGRLKAEDSKTNHYEFPAFVLKRADRKLAGQILGRDGKPVVGARVNMSGQGQFLFRETKSDGQGHFNFDGVCAGEVKVDARYYNSPDFSNQEQGDVMAQGGDTNVVIRLGIYSGNNKYLSPPLKTTGIVSDPFGAPVAGATVSLFPVQSRDITVQTDAKGHYDINWQARLSGDETHWLLARDLKRNLAALLQVDQKMTNVDLSLEDGLTLSSQVHDSSGKPVTNATATAMLWEGNRGFRLDPQPIQADKNGRLRLSGLPQGNKYWVEVGATNHTSTTLHAEAAETKTNFLELPPSVLELTDGEVSGRVLDAEGKPAAGIEVQMFSSGMPTPRTTTDASGHFEYHGVRRGALSFMAGLPIANSSALNNSGSARGKSGDTNVVIRLTTGSSTFSRLLSSPTITTSGTVFDPSGKPAPGVLLAMLPSGGLRTPVQSDANGKYSLQWQTLFLRATSSTKPMILARDPAHNLAATGEIDTNTASLDLHLQPGLTLSGAVRDSNGRQVTNAIVQLVPYPPDDKRATLNQMPPTNASPEGLFFFSALPSGAPYRVNVSAAGYGSSNVTAQATDTATREFRLPTAVLNFANQQLAGQVIGLDGKPCWGAEVTVSGDGQPAGRISHSDANGHFVITEVCAGSLNVRAMLPASATNPRPLIGLMQSHGGETNIVVKLGQ